MDNRLDKSTNKVGGENMLKNSEELINFLNQEEVLIVLDSSAILDIYKHDQAYSHNLLKTYQINLDKVWVPNHVSVEVERNQHSVEASRKTEIDRLPKNINESIGKLKQNISALLKNPRKFNYPSIPTLDSQLESKIDELEQIVIDYENQVCSIVEDRQPGIVSEFLKELEKEDKIGTGYDIFDKLAIYTEGNIRYELNIPPGFKDAKPKDKKDEKNKKDKKYEIGTRKFGDLIIWKEILDKINSERQSLLFITSDVKCDWWELDEDKKIIDKHTMLNEEFEKITGLPEANFEMLFTGTFFNLMLGTEAFINQSYDETIELIVTDYSLNALEKVGQFVTVSDIGDDLNEKLSLDFEFSNGDFTTYVEEPFTELDVNEVTATDIIEVNVSNEEDYLKMSIELSSICDVDTKCTIYGDNEIDYRYDVYINYMMYITIPINENEDIDTDVRPYPIFNEENMLDLDNVEIDYEYGEIYQVITTSSPFDAEDEYDELCGKCKVRQGEYRMFDHEPLCSPCSEKMTPCPDCGLFFPSGSIGAFCDACAPNH